MLFFTKINECTKDLNFPNFFGVSNSGVAVSKYSLADSGNLSHKSYSFRIEIASENVV